MSAFERVLIILGHKKVMASFFLTVLLGALLLGMGAVKGNVETQVLITFTLFILAFMVAAFLKSGNGDLIGNIKEAVKETDGRNDDDTETQAEPVDPLPWDEPVPTLDVLDPVIPDPPLVKALGPASLLNWPKGEAERTYDP